MDINKYPLSGQKSIVINQHYNIASFVPNHNIKKIKIERNQNIVSPNKLHLRMTNHSNGSGQNKSHCVIKVIIIINK